jgi:hypothetical protein
MKFHCVHGKRYMVREQKCVVMTTKEESPFIPIVVTLVAAICWAIFMLLHILFWSSNFSLFQNIVIILLSIVVVGGVIGLMWVFWVFRRA